MPKAVRLPSGSWYCRCRVDGQDISITRPTEKAAVAEVMAIKARIRHENRPENITLTKAIDRYIADRDGILSPSTIRGYRTIQQNRLQGIMHTPISRINTQAIQRAINLDAKNLSPKTIKNTVGLLSGVLRYFDVSMGKIAVPELEKNEKQIYTSDELRTLMSAIRGTTSEIPVLLAMWLGLRQSEIIALKWSSVDFAGGTIYVDSAIVPGPDHRPVEKGTKTASSKRVLPCPAYILDILAAADKTGDNIIQCTAEALRRRLHKICDDAGIPYYGYHALRHQNASTMLLLNIPDKYVMERGGWSSLKTPKQIYQHTMDEGRQAATAAIDAYFNRLMDDQ